ncbi:alanine racemase [Nocardioides alcanivorans]|uniref:alanine racemase n=1 Tax=Nocardioides alcanivorans TaxID=2897352 RepID=UPI001F20EA4B|nr:alanine racemase [Nocardioides alcanivorans]
MTASARAEIVVDVAAIRHNVRRLRQLVTRPDGAAPACMAVVKADGYGHGMVPVAKAAREAGADWLGVATLEEAVALRDAGDTGPLLAWLAVPGEDHAPALERDVDVASYSLTQLTAIADAARRTGRTARVHLKIDTGLSRGGATRDDWPALVDASAALETTGAVEVVGIWSHLVASDEPDRTINDEQEQRFRDAASVAEAAGLRPRWRHLANSAAGLLRPSAHFDMVRFGIATYGLDPAPGETHDLGLVPAMTVQARLGMVKQVRAGDGVSYGHQWVADRDTLLGLVPAGYAEGIARAAGNRAEVWADDARRPVRGRICMDQFMIDLGPDSTLAAGDRVELFGTGHDGAPTAQDWAEACHTINYEIVTRIGGRFARVYVDSEVTQ